MLRLSLLYGSERYRIDGIDCMFGVQGGLAMNLGRPAALLLTAVLFFTSLLFAEFPASAAEIEFKGPTVHLDGDIEPGDDLRFAGSTALRSKGTVIVLRSGGGEPNASLSIGRLIRKRGFATRVDEYCTSSCALIWLAGEPRSVDANARISFQNPTSRDAKTPEEGPVREDYLSALGLSNRMVRFALSRARSDIKYLTRKDAKRLHLSVQFH
jgi:hypothetical protein